MRKPVASLVLLLVAAPAARLPAQSWSGPASLGVEARSRGGQPVAGALVTLHYQGVDSAAGPPRVMTDARGRAVVVGLAEGEWQLEVEHEDFLSYVAVVSLRAGKKPAVSASYLQAGGRSLTPMRVKFFRAAGKEPSRSVAAAAPAPAPATPAPPARTAPAPESPLVPAEPERREPDPGEATHPPTPPDREEPTPPPASETRAALPAAKPAEPPALREPAPTAPEPPPAPEAPADPAAPTQEPAATAPAPPAPSEALPVQAPEVEAPPVQAPEVEARPVEPLVIEPKAAPQPPHVTPPPLPVVPVPPREDSPSPPPVAAPPPPDTLPIRQEVASDETSEPRIEAIVESPQAPPPAETSASQPPPAPAPPRIAMALQSDADCPECQTGDWSVVSSQSVGAYRASQPGCPGDQQAAFRRAMETVANSIYLELSAFAGPLADGSPAEALRFVSDAEAVAFRSEIAGGPDHCRPVGVVLPRAARFLDYRYEASDRERSGGCLPGEDCNIGRGRWLGRPEIVRGTSSTVIYGVFQNLADEHERRATLSVYFRPPSAAWRPPAR